MLHGKRQNIGRLVLGGLFLCALLMSSGCGWDFRSENDRLKREIAGLTAENDRLEVETKQRQGELAELRTQNADLHVQIVSLQDKNQTLQKEIDTLKEQLWNKRK
jgi:septal ring factor EnvC (AmiA/AmiB activator)